MIQFTISELSCAETFNICFIFDQVPERTKFICSISDVGKLFQFARFPTCWSLVNSKQTEENNTDA